MFVEELKKANFDFETLPNDLRETVNMLLKVPSTLEDSQKIELLDFTVIKSIAAILPENETVVKIYNTALNKMDSINNDGFNTDTTDSQYELNIHDKVRNAVGILLHVVDKTDSEYFLTTAVSIPGTGLPWGKAQVHSYLEKGIWKKAAPTIEMAYGGQITKETPGFDKNTGNRPSPTAHASHHPVGTEAIGNDGYFWEVKEDKNGKHAWKNSGVIVPESYKNKLENEDMDNETVIVGYTSAPEAYDYPGTETIETTEYFDREGTGKPVRLVHIKERGYPNQKNRYESGFFGFYDKADFEKMLSFGDLSPFQKKVETPKLDVTAYKNPYEVNRAIEKFLDENWNKENFDSHEVEFLRYYSGYGGLDKLGDFSPDEFKTILYEYYTPDDVVKKMWALAYKYGYGEIGDNSVMEPSVGIGAFLKYAPENVRTTGNEINKYSAKICSILYPNADIELQPFEKNFIKQNLSIKGHIVDLAKYSLIIGNPPYGKLNSKYIGMGEDKYTRASNFTEYFITRGLDLLQSGGLLIYIVGAEQHSGGKLFLDSPVSPVKEAIFEKAELLDAYRLPINIFERTGVSSEILVFKKL